VRVKKYDYLIVGSGFSGAVCARELSLLGYKCLVIDKKSHIGGNCYTYKVEGIDVHKYGPHIFHTNNKKIWDYVNSLCELTHYKHKVKVNYKNEIYSFPINLDTFYKVYGTKTPKQAIKIPFPKKSNNDSLKSFCISKIGIDFYKIFIEGYTKKQWGVDPEKLPSSIIKRIPIRYTFDDNYYLDQFQGIPKYGYTYIFEKLLEGIDLHLCEDYTSDLKKICKKVIYTGAIDEFFNYSYGRLDYRSLKFEHEIYNIPYFQGCAQINYTDELVPFTRKIEHKHFLPQNSKKTVVTTEFPCHFSDGMERYYPIGTLDNKKIYNLYKEKIPSDFIFLGRLAEYKYYDMHQVISSALMTVFKEVYGKQTKQSFDMFMDSCSKRI
jgi:UDP-galactopyranose mutase